jgi:AraC-like DNA-binding protein
MEYRFDMNCTRSIQGAHPCFFDQPLPHPSRNMPWHDFIYMVSGEWRIGLGKETYTLRRNEVLLLPANLYHYAIGECTPKTHTLFFHISAADGDVPLSPSPSSAAVSDSHLTVRNHIQVADSPNIKNLFEKIIQTQTNDRIATAYFHTLLYELKCISPPMSRSGLAQDMFDYIQGSDKLLTNQTVADYFHISKRTAEIVFKNEFHTTIHQFVTDSILKKARRYMNDYPHMKMSSIATALGFCDEFHFSKVFKSKLGMSPSAYKKKIRGGGYTDSGSS